VCASICLEGLIDTMKYLSQDSEPLDEKSDTETVNSYSGKKFEYNL
jgi:hypothetical protein